MAIETKLMTNPVDLKNLSGSYGFRCLSQRRDGVLVHYYITASGIAVSYSYDFGMTWTQRVEGNMFGSELHTLLLSTGEVHHIGYTAVHTSQRPCETLVDKTNINSPWLWTPPLDHQANGSQVICTMVDDEDKIHVIFKDNAFKDFLYYTVYDPSTETFSFPETFTNGASSVMGIAPDNAFQMAMDSTGKIHVLYINHWASSPGMFYQYRDINGTWSAPIGGVASTAVTRSLQSGGSNFDVSYPSMVIDGNDNVHIVYSLHFDGAGDVGGYRSIIDYGKWNGSTFDRTVIYEVADRRAEYSILSVDEVGNLYIVYGKNKASAGTAYDIFMIKSTDGGATWGPEQTVIAGTTERYVPIYLFKTERNVPGYNILKTGCAGVYGINYEFADTDLYFFYTDDVDYKFPLSGGPEFCSITTIECEANPIWCMLDLMTNKRYGLGNYINESNIDLQQMAEDADYCDELVGDGHGGQEVRHRMDVVIDNRVKAMDLISQLCASFRAMPFYSMGQIFIKIDKPQAISTQLFTMGNMIKGSFAQKWKSDKERFNIIEVQFLDKDKDYVQETILVIDEEAFEVNGEDQRPHQIRLFVTRMSEAIREGRYAMKVSKYIDKIVSFRSQINALVAQPMDRIDISHDLPQIGFSGKILAGSTTTSIVLDREVTVEAGKTYKLKVKFDDDTLEEVTVTNSHGNYSTLTVSPAFAAAPDAYDDYVFGEENILVEPMRIVSIERDNADNVSIGAVEYVEDVYIDDVIVIPETKYSQLDTSFPEVTNLLLKEVVVKNASGTIANYIDVSFSKPNLSNNPIFSYDHAKIYISDNGGANYILAGETSGEGFRITENVIPGLTYTVVVVSVTKSGIEGAIDNSPSSTITIHTSLVFEIDLWAQNREYKLVNIDRVQMNLFNADYTRDVFVLKTGTTWQDVEGQDWEGLDLGGQTVESSGSIEMSDPVDLGFLSLYYFDPAILFKNVSGGSITTQISTSEDGVTYSAFATIVPATAILCRYVKLKFIIQTSDTTHQVFLYSAIIGVDSPIIVLEQS